MSEYLGKICHVIFTYSVFYNFYGCIVALDGFIKLFIKAVSQTELVISDRVQENTNIQHCLQQESQDGHVSLT